MWKVLRVKANLTDDPDWVGTQDSGGTFNADGQPKAIRGSTASPSSRPATVEVMVEFLDAAGARVTTNQGVFDVQVIKRRTVDVAGLAAAIAGSSTLVGEVGFVPFLIDDTANADEVSVRLTNIVNAAATNLRVLYKEFTET